MPTGVYIRTEKTKKILSNAQKRIGNRPPINYGSENIMWKGDNVSYNALHDWVRRHKGTPRECTFCMKKNAKKYEWANISKKYLRSLNDWKSLCVSCHKKYDDSANKAWITRRKNLILQ